VGADAEARKNELSGDDAKAISSKAPERPTLKKISRHLHERAWEACRGKGNFRKPAFRAKREKERGKDDHPDGLTGLRVNWGEDFYWIDEVF